MASTNHKFLLLIFTYVLLYCLTTGSASDAVGNDSPSAAEGQTKNAANETNILKGLKAVLNKVKNKIYPNIPDAVDNIISPTPTVNDSSISEAAEKTYQLVDRTVTEMNRRTPNNWFTIINSDWNGKSLNPNSIKDSCNQHEPLPQKHKQPTVDDVIELATEEHSSSREAAMLTNSSTNDDESTISNDTSTASNDTSSDDLKLSETVNITEKLTNISSYEEPKSTNVSSNDTEERASYSGMVHPDIEIHMPGVNISHESLQPILLESVTMETDSSIRDGAKVPESGKIETYSQFAERVSAEKKNGDGNVPIVLKPLTKVQTKNYASQDCGAKLLTSNSDASFPAHVMTKNKDEYMLNKCNSETNFVVIELCESIRTQKFDVANFELFSNVPKNIRLYGSRRYPARDWILIGEFQGEEGNREVQSFVTDSDKFIKNVKLEVTSHYGTEFYCPLSLFRIYGISEFEAIDHMEYDADDFEEEQQQQQIVTTTQAPKASGWDLKSLVGKVLSVIKRGSISYRSHTEQEDIKSFTRDCRSLDSKFAIQVEQCPGQEYLNYILSCYHDEYVTLLQQKAIATTVENDVLCNLLSQSLCGTPVVPDAVIYGTLCKGSYPCIMLSPRHIFALCYMTYPHLIRNMSSKCQSDGALYISSEAPANNDSIEYKNTMVSNDSETSLSSESPLLKTSGVADKSDHAKHDGVDESKSKHAEEIKDTLGSDHGDEKVTNTSASSETIARPNLNDEQLKSRLQNTSEGASDVAQPSEPKVVSQSNINKESIMVRLSNKIKVLEENMSISSQYLEELSQTYKRQMEEMQRQFNITITALNKSSQFAFDRDLIHHSQIESLEERLQSLNRTVEILLQWNNSAVNQVFFVHCVVIVVELALLFVMYKRFDRLFEEKVSRVKCRCSCKGQVVQNGKIPADDSSTLRTINRSPSGEALNPVNFNGFVGRSQEWIRAPQNGFRARPSESNLAHTSSSSNFGVEEINASHPNYSEVRVQSNSGTVPTENSGLLNHTDSKQVIPFRVDNGSRYEFNCSTGDFNAPVISDYYTVRSDTSLQSEPNHFNFSGQIPNNPYNYEGFQSYMQWCYQQSLHPVPTATPVGLSHPDSGLRFQNPASVVEQNPSSGLTTLDPRLRSGNPSLELKVQNLDSRVNTVDVHSDMKSPPSTGLGKEGSEVKTKPQESSKETSKSYDSGAAARNEIAKSQDSGVKKQESSKKNKKKKNKLPKHF